MKKSLLWITKLILRTAFFVWMAYSWTHAGNMLDSIPAWLGLGVALGLLWPLYWKLICDVYGALADDVASRVEKRISPELHAFYRQYQMDTRPPSAMPLFEPGGTFDEADALAMGRRDRRKPITVSLHEILSEIRSLPRH